MGTITVLIHETGKTETLSAIDSGSGVNWIGDLLGNSGAFDLPLDNGGIVFESDEEGPTGTYRCTQGTYEWWATYIRGMEQIAEDLDQLREDLEEAGLDAADIIRFEYEAELGSVDMEDERGQSLALIEAIRQQHLVSAE